MSITTLLICEETKTKIWIGQSDYIYYAEKDTMERLNKFLQDNKGRCLKFVSDFWFDDVNEHWTSY